LVSGLIIPGTNIVALLFFFLFLDNLFDYSGITGRILISIGSQRRYKATHGPTARFATSGAVSLRVNHEEQ
jgi:hypothetical protein